MVIVTAEKDEPTNKTIKANKANFLIHTTSLKVIFCDAKSVSE
jgi:hypothetical protein